MKTWKIGLNYIHGCLQITGSTDPEKFRSLVGANRRADQPYDGSGDYDALYSDMTIVVTTGK